MTFIWRSFIRRKVWKIKLGETEITRWCMLFISPNKYTSLIPWINIRHIVPHWRPLSHCGESRLLPLDYIIFSTLCYPRNIPALSMNSALSDYQGCWTTIRELQMVSCVGGTWKEATTAETQKKKKKEKKNGARRDRGSKRTIAHGRQN